MSECFFPVPAHPGTVVCVCVCACIHVCMFVVDNSNKICLIPDI